MVNFNKRQYVSCCDCGKLLETKDGVVGNAWACYSRVMNCGGLVFVGYSCDDCHNATFSNNPKAETLS